jgi:hypothetical protein
VDYPSREELLVLKMKIGSSGIWPKTQLWVMNIPVNWCVYRHLYGVQSGDESRFTPMFEMSAEWQGEVLEIKPYRYHDHPQMDLIDPHNPIEALLKIDMEDIWP